MGGVAGHMDHLYDNRNLTFAKMKEIMQAGADAELSTEEKVDGQNLFLSYSISEGKAKGARNKGNLRGGGLDASGLAKKFAGRGGLEKAFNSGFSAFEKAVESLSDGEKQKIFGPDTNIWYNSEVMDPGTEGDADDPGSVNVIKYDNKTLKIHNVGHFVFDRESGEKEPIPEGALETLDNAYDRMQNSLHGNDFSLARKAIIQLQKLEDQDALQRAFSKINSTVSAEGLSDKSTIEQFLFTRLVNGLDTDLPRNLKEQLAKYLLQTPDNIGKRALKKNLTKEDQQDLDNIIKNKRMILRDAILPIEMAVHDYTVAILAGLKSVFISDNDKEVQRLKSELTKAVEEITAKGPEDPSSMEVMQFHLNKIKDFSQLTTPIEAVVFDYDGHTYKFAGNFAPLNQILGMYRYPKDGRKIATENLTKNAKPVTEVNGRKVALLPGGFKPPHAGHYGLAKMLASDPDIDEVIVIIGKNPRFSTVEPKIKITAEQSKNLWDLYTRKDRNIKVRVQEGKTPVADVYDLIADKNSFSEGDVVVLGKSDKDVGDTRYDRAQSWAERNNPGVSVEEMIFPVIGGKNMGGSNLRNVIADDQRDIFFSMLPDHLNEKEKEDAWISVTSNFNETLNSLIDDQIDEMSTMAAGAVEIGVGPFGFGGKTNSYNPYSKNKNKKPKVKEQNAKGGDNYNTMKKTTLDRNDFIAEQLIREHVRKKVIKKLQITKLAEQKIRTAVRIIIEAETGTDEPSAQTGINVLADLLEKVIPTIEADYKMLTTSEEQRESFRNHIVHALKNSLRPIEAATSAEDMSESITYNLNLDSLKEELKIDLDPEGDEEAVSGEFIDIDSEGAADGDDFIELDDQNETGRNFAAVTFKKVEKQIVDAYDMLADNEDQDIFYDYLVTNMLLYFDKFEDELQPSLPDVTTPEYEEEKDESSDENDLESDESAIDDLLS